MGRDRNLSWAITDLSEELVAEFSTRARHIEMEKDRLVSRVCCHAWTATTGCDRVRGACGKWLSVPSHEDQRAHDGEAFLTAESRR